jgi:hypothetical protein
MSLRFQNYQCFEAHKMASRSVSPVWIFPSAIPSNLPSPSCLSAAGVELVYYQARDGALAVGIAIAASARPSMASGPSGASLIA